MIEISTNLIKQAVYNLCFQANTCLNKDMYHKISCAFEIEQNDDTKNYLKNILLNSKIAYEEKMPLCQDTGLVLVFLEIGQNIHLTDDFLYDTINNTVENCYRENFFRKSVVKNAVFERINTKTNTPCIIYTKYTKSDDIKIKVLIKGAGSENKSSLEMLLPTSTEEEIVQKCSEKILTAGMNACPPMFVGIGIGETADKALLMSKEVFFEKNFSQEELLLAEKIKKYVNTNAPKGFENAFVLDVKIKTSCSHIASMPVGITINCHSDRFSCAIIKNNEIFYEHKKPDFKILEENKNNIKEIKTNDINAIKSLKKGDSIFLSGEIYIARDMAHKKLIEMINKGQELPFDIKDKIIFYAGPCPNPPDKVIGSVGPTTAERMDKYAKKLYEKGVIATIGKGSRSEELSNYIKTNNKKYFSVQGGIAALLAKNVKKCKIVAFEELGAEAIYKIYADKLPVKNEF